jgi:hypothetical protein
VVCAARSPLRFGFAEADRRMRFAEGRVIAGLLCSGDRGVRLGIEAQRADISAYVAAAGCALIAEYVETETGKKHDLTNRPVAATGKSLRAIAATLNEQGHTTRTGRPWNPVQVSRVLKAAA